MRWIAVAGLVLIGLSLAACREAEEEAATGYQPARLEPIKGSDVKRVVLTAEGARRIGLQTASIRRAAGHDVVTAAALLYDPEGGTYVYTVSGPRSFVRRPVEVDRIDGDRVRLSSGPRAGTGVVTVGAAEVHGAELEIAADH